MQKFKLALAAAALITALPLLQGCVAAAVGAGAAAGVMTAHGWDSPMVKVGDTVIFERARSVPVDKPNFIIALWAGDVLGIEREAEITRPTLNGRLVEAN